MALHSHIEARVTRRGRRRIRAARPVPAPGRNEPADEEILRYLDGAMDADELAAFEARLEHSPYAAARIELLAAALEENGWPVSDDVAPSPAGPRRGSA